MDSEQESTIVEKMFQNYDFFVSGTNEMVTEARRKMHTEGLMELCLLKQDLTQGQLPVVRTRARVEARVDICTLSSYSVPEINHDYSHDLHQPPEHLFNDTIKLRKNSGSPLTDFKDAINAHMIRTDKLFVSMLDEFATQIEPVAGIRRTFDDAIAQCPNAHNLLIGSQVWSDLVADPECIEYLEPTARYELLLVGRMGVYVKDYRRYDITTDAYRHPDRRVLDPKAIYVVPDPLMAGQYTDRYDNLVQELPMKIATVHNLREAIVSRLISMVLTQRPVRCVVK